MVWKISLIYLYLYIHQCNSQYRFTTRKEETVFEIVGIFTDQTSEQTLAFNETTLKANLNDRKLSPTLLYSLKTDSFSVWEQLCKNEDVRPIAIFGPQDTVSDSVVREQCAIVQIPHLQAAWQPFDPDIEVLGEIEEVEETSSVTLEENDEESENGEDNDDDEEETPAETENEKEEEVEEKELIYKNITINFYPDSHEITLAYAQLLKYYNWENFAVLYEDDYGLSRIQKVLAVHTNNFPIFVRKLNPDGDNGPIFKELKKYQESRILLDCYVNNIMKYMNHAKLHNIVDHYQHYILMSLDAAMYADELKVFPSNITWLSMTEHEKLSNADHFLSSRVGAWTHSQDFRPVYKFNLESLLMFDMANQVILAVNQIEEEENLSKLPSLEYSICGEDMEVWQYGAALQDKILNLNSTGVSGNIQFDPNTGKRFNYTLYVNEIYVTHLRTIGQWTSMEPNEITINKSVEDSENGTGLNTRKEFIVKSRRAKPYFDIKKPCEQNDLNCDGTEEFEGFAVDLVKAIFETLNNTYGITYTYKFVHEADKSYGSYNKLEKKWDGLIGDLLNKEADLAVCDLSITEERKAVVDFSVPFMTLGISILYTNIDPIPPGMFSFLNPYSLDVWMYIATAYCGVSVVLYICARISPPDWENPQPCDKDPEELENIWNFKNCTWLTMGSIMTQGCDILPKAFGSRWVCGMWWFFAVIVCQTYIAQLSASMTSAMEDDAINSIEDLAKQSKVMYGCIASGSTLSFFKNSNDKMYRGIYEKMISNDGILLANNNDEGEKRVLNGHNKYAFFMESTTIDYKMKRDCRLRKVGGLLDSKDYGIAMPANSPFRTDINRAILRLKELTTLDNITNKWWNPNNLDDKCKENEDEGDVEGDLEVSHLIGAFVVLIAGLGCSVLITAAEFIDEVRNIVVREQVTHKEAFIKELKSSLNFTQLQKPVLRNPSRAPSIVETNQDKQARRAHAMENFLDLEKVVQ